LYAQTGTVYNATSIAVLSALFSELGSSISDCNTELNVISPANQVVYANRTISNTTACSSFVDSNDACCNFAANQKGCCSKREIKVDDIPSSLATSTSQLNSKCRTPTKSAQTIKNIYQTVKLTKSDEFMKTTMATTLGTVIQICLFKVQRLAVELCSTNADCHTGETCIKSATSTQGFCLDTVTPVNKQVLGCIVEGLPGKAKRFFLNLLGGKASSTADQLQAAYDARFTRSFCIDSVTKSELPQFTNMTSCLTEQVCSLQTNGTSGASFTAANCPVGKSFCSSTCGSPVHFGNETCTKDIPHLTNQTDCLAAKQCGPYGYLVPGTSRPFDNQTCFNGTFKYCNVNFTCTSANGCNPAASCTFQCLSILQIQGKCVVPHTAVSNGGFSCPVGSSAQYGVGCILSSTTETNVTCAAQRGIFVPTPRNKAECDASIMGCQLKDGSFRILSSSECTKCGGSMAKYPGISTLAQEPVFDAQFVSSGEKWTSAKLVPKNIWITGPNQAAQTDLITAQVFANYGFLFATEELEGKMLQARMLETFACDCASTKAPNGTNCFAPVTVPRSSFVAYSQMEDVHSTESYTVGVKSTSVSVAQDVVAVRASLTVGRVASNTGLYDIFFENTTSGFAASNGVSLKVYPSTASFSFNLCIKKLNVTAPSTNKVPSFAYYSPSDVLTQTTLTVMDYPTEMCADVSDSRVYYASYFATTPGNPTTSPRVSTPRVSSNPVSSGASMFVTVLALFFMVIAFMF
jgi:hypothetical protein